MIRRPISTAECFNYVRPADRGWRCILYCLVAGAAVPGLAGCGSRSTFEFDELDVTRARDELIEYSLGRYEIPIPVASVRAGGGEQRQNRLEFDFELFALVEAELKPQLADTWRRSEGSVRDCVIRVCRNASLEDLQEPELATLKARLMDALAAQLGDREVQRLLITDVVCQEL